MGSQAENGGLISYGGGCDRDAKQRGAVEWLNSMLPDLNLSAKASETDIRACLLDGTVLCCILNRLMPGLIEMGDGSEPQSAYIQKFFMALDKMGLPRFELSDLEQGSMEEVFQFLQTLRENLHTNAEEEARRNHARKRWNRPDKSLNALDSHQGDAQQFTESNVERHRAAWDQTVLGGPAISEPFAGLSTLSETGNVLNDMFQGRKGCQGDLVNVNISDLMKWDTLDVQKAPMQLLFGIIGKVLNESFERKNGGSPHPVACLLRKLLGEIERRISSQADKIKHQNTIARSHERKYQAKVRALETLAVGALEESQVVMSQLLLLKNEKKELEKKKQHDEQDVVKLLEKIIQRDDEILALKHEIKEAKTSYENRHAEQEKKAKETKGILEKKIEDLDSLVKDSRIKVKELEQFSETQIHKLKKKELLHRNFVDSQFSLTQGLRTDLDSVKREILRTKKCYPAEFENFGIHLKELVDAAENYHTVLTENRRLYNEVQDLKGNIRVYCRIRPFLPGQSQKQTTIEHIGENGDLVVANPLKQGKDSRRLFKFNKVFAPTASQEEVFKDTQPLIRSVLDGYNVCIFAYGQTGSGKTYTMSGPNLSSPRDWGVNYRALHDLFEISQSRRTSIVYEVGVQMVEIYNEQVRDLLASDGAQKRLGIWNTSQPNGLAVPEASMHAVRSTSDVLELMNTGLMNRAVGATALNERSSRSHSILNVHVRGTDLKSNSVLRGCLHLVDLAGSERVDRSEATGDRLREAQHINKSLSALGDVIFALAQKSSHVPYRNSKLTQVLQSSLGGQAKTLMFVQLNPDPESHSETVSTLKFAERVSGVELGAARSNKEGRDLRDLMDQVSSLKEVIVRKDEEIERLRPSKVNGSFQTRGTNTMRGNPTPPHSPMRQQSIESTRYADTLSEVRSPGHPQRVIPDHDVCSDNNAAYFGGVCERSMDEFIIKRQSLRQSDIAATKLDPNSNDDVNLLGFGDADSEERLSDISDGGLSMGTETDGSMSGILENTLLPGVSKPVESSDKTKLPSKLPKLLVKQTSLSSSQPAPPKASPKAVSSSRKTPAANGLSTRLKPKSTLKSGSKLKDLH